MKSILTIFTLLIMNISNAQFVSEDDVLHFGVGVIISTTTYAVVNAKTKNKKKAFWYSLGVSTLAGLSKEIFDEFVFEGRFDTGELIATFSGGFIASYTFNIFTGKKKKNVKKLANLKI